MIVHVDPDPGFTAKVDAGETVHAHVETYSPGHGGIELETLNVSENGTYDAPSGKAYDHVNAAVPQTTIESKSVTANGTYTAPAGKAYSPVTVNVPQTSIQPLSVSANGAYTAPGGVAYSPVVVSVPSGQDRDYPAKDVNFYDYDGKIVAAYTASEFAALNAMPANPAHLGLTAQGWNWTLEDAKSYVATYGMLEIGQMYVSSSGNTEIDVELVGADLSPVLMLELDGAANVYWGDGRSTYATGTHIGYNQTIFLPHTYSAPGTYTISIVLTSGSRLGLAHRSSNNNYSGMFSDKSAWSNSARYASAMKAIRIGSGLVYIGGGAFSHCSALTAIPMPSSLTSLTNASFDYSYFKHITIPSGNTYFSGVNGGYNLASISIPKSIATSSFANINSCPMLKRVSCPPSVTSIVGFYDCFALERVSIPSGVTSLGTNAFYCNYALKKVDVPVGVTSIKDYTFQACFTLTQLTIPSGVTTIGKQAFSQCSSLRELHVQATTPPTIAYSTFTDFPGAAVIYVPSASANDYKAAWSNVASQIQGE